MILLVLNMNTPIEEMLLEEKDKFCDKFNEVYTSLKHCKVVLGDLCESRM